MESLPVIVLLNEDLDVAAQVPKIPILGGVDLLPFQCLQKTLAAGMVIGVGRPAHARDHLVLAEHRDVWFHAPRKNSINRTRFLWTGLRITISSKEAGHGSILIETIEGPRTAA